MVLFARGYSWASVGSFPDMGFLNTRLSWASVGSFDKKDVLGFWLLWAFVGPLVLVIWVIRNLGYLVGFWVSLHP